MTRNLILTFIFTILSTTVIVAGVPRYLVEGSIYFQGDSIVNAEKPRMMAIPRGKRPVEIVSDAYTHSARVQCKIKAAGADSVVVWSPTTPGRRHRITMIPGYGWCLFLGGDRLSVFAFCKKGYHVSGNGGVWCRGKFVILVKTPDGIEKFDNPSKMANDKFRKHIADLAIGDIELYQHILNSRTTRVKTVRLLENFNF